MQKWVWFCAKETYIRRGVVAVHFLLQSQGGTGEFMYKGSILGNKHLSIQSICHETILLTTSSALSFIIYACGTILGGIVTDIPSGTPEA